MNSAAAYCDKRSDFFRRYPPAAMSAGTRTDQNRSQALCIMNFRSFSMFDHAEPLSSRKKISRRRNSDPKYFSLQDSHRNTRPGDSCKRNRLSDHCRCSRSSFQIMVDRKESAAASGRPASVSCPGQKSGDKRVRGYIRSPQKMISAGRLSVMASVILLLLTMSLFLRIFTGTGTDVRAGIPLSEVQYKVVEIKYGDTLWSIAKNNMNPGYNSIKDYISDIKDCNQMSSDNLTTGGYLMLPYYEYVRDDTL